MEMSIDFDRLWSAIPKLISRPPLGSDETHVEEFSTD